VAPASEGEVLAGVVANPRSGHDVRRLVARATVFPTPEKVAMLERVLTSLGALGVQRVVSMGDRGGVWAGLARAVETHHPERDPRWPSVEVLDLPVRGTAEDSRAAAAAMTRLGVAVIVTLGGDGTARAVGGACGDVPVLALSTGTNNAFARVGEATVAGLAAGLVATGQVDRDEACRRAKVLWVDQGSRREAALVDVAVTDDDAVAARAVWHPASVRELFVTNAEPDAIGLSSVAGLVHPLSRDEPLGLHLTLRPEADTRVLAPIAPGLVAEVGVSSVTALQPGEAVALRVASGVVALDGEREIELRGTRATVTLSLDGPWTVDIARTMALAASRGLLTRSPRPTTGR
jgi:predicted polyphosphate/ATP-dependent NAD kinase